MHGRHVTAAEWRAVVAAGADPVTLPGALKDPPRTVGPPHGPHARLCCVDTRSRASRMNALLRTLLTLAHLLHSLYVAVRYACDTAYRWCAGPWHADATTELDALVRTLTKSKRLPRHLVIVLGLRDEPVLDCVRIIGWCITLDIPYVSFFDRDGKNKIFVLIYHCYLYVRGNLKKKNEKKNCFMCTLDVYRCVCVCYVGGFKHHLSCEFIVRLS